MNVILCLFVFFLLEIELTMPKKASFKAHFEGKSNCCMRNCLVGLCGNYLVQKSKYILKLVQPSMSKSLVQQNESDNLNNMIRWGQLDVRYVCKNLT